MKETKNSNERSYKEIITQLNGIASEYGYGKGSAYFNNEQWNAINVAKDIINDYERLTDENAQLKSRLENTVELPTMSELKIVDINTNFYQTAYVVLYKRNGKLYIYQCFDKAKAETTLKQLQGSGDHEV